MKKTLLIRITFCLTIIGVLSFLYLDRQNDVTKYRMEIPVLAKEIQSLGEQVKRLEYQIERFENPQNLMQLAECVDFSHLKYPAVSEVWILREANEAFAVTEKTDPTGKILPKTTFAFGSSP